MRNIIIFLLLTASVGSQELIPNIDQMYQKYTSYTWNCHVHTGNSDGKAGSVEEVVRRNLTTTAQIVALTDHGEHLSQQEWRDQGQMAGLRWNLFRGFELTGTTVDNATKIFQPYNTPGWGHLLIYRSNTFTATKILGDGNPPSLNDTYTQALSWVEKRPETLAAFAHPSLYLVETTFDNFRSPPKKAIVKQVFGCELSAHSFPELYTGLGDISKGLRASNEACFRELLRKGWRIAPIMGGDQHGPSYGNVTTLTGLWLKQPLKTSIYEAMEARRCFATEDPRASIKFMAWQGGQTAIMGEDLGVRGDSFFVSCKVEGVAAKQITFVGVSRAGADLDFEIQSQNLESGRSFFGDDIPLNLVKYKRAVCIYAKAKLAGGKDIVSAPIWLKGAF
ncbi:hypothetical protein KC644_04000 [Candidatus Berkelbacteria bacterium]|nr:hypothetical protein [Candidatus Berkelbacteria bacterium]